MKGNMSIKSVKLYKLHGVQWVFDDPAKEIYQEAFVNGADELLDEIVGKYDPNNNYTLQFSTKDFPNADFLEFLPSAGVEKYSKDTHDPNELILDTGSYWVHTNGKEEKLVWLCDTLDEYIGIDDKLLFFNVKCFKPTIDTESKEMKAWWNRS